MAEHGFKISVKSDFFIFTFSHFGDAFIQSNLQLQHMAYELSVC